MLLYVNWNETTNIWRNFRSFHNIMYKRSRSKDWRTNNALAPLFSEIKDNNLRLYACQIKDRQYQRSTLEVKDEQIWLSFDAWGQGLTDEQHSRYSLEAECGREMAFNTTWMETSNPDWHAWFGLVCAAAIRELHVIQGPNYSWCAWENGVLYIHVFLVEDSQI